MNDFDVVIVGAGAAGLGAARHLCDQSLDVAVLEARSRVGGRAHTIRGRTGVPLDLGCEWLHSADRNPLVAIAEARGFVIDKTPPPWDKKPTAMPQHQREAWVAFSRALQEFERRLEQAAATGQDRPAADFLEPNSLCNPLLNAFSTYYNGAEFDEVSTLDYSAYEDSGINWRIADGYGTFISSLGDGARVFRDAPVSVIDHSGSSLCLSTSRGVIRAQAVIVTVPSNILANEHLRFVPGVPDKVAAAAGLPLGLVNKLFLSMRQADVLPQDTQLYGRTDRVGTGSYHFRPLGRPYVEAYFGGRHAHALEMEGPHALAEFAMDELAGALGADIRDQLTPIIATSWGTDPFACGSYSHALPGRVRDRARLAEPIDQRIFFAGEACSINAFSTAHGAYETGVAAAEAVLRSFSRVDAGPADHLRMAKPA